MAERKRRWIWNLKTRSESQLCGNWGEARTSLGLLIWMVAVTVLPYAGCEGLHSFPRAATTKYHELDGLKPQKSILSQF